MSDNINQDIAISGQGNIVVGKGDVIFNPLPPAEARLRHDLGILLKNVRTTWIQGVLEKSVHEAALLEIGMELRDDAVENPWLMVMEGPDQTRQTLSRGRKIKDIFDEANRLLLILGEPGSGKTTTLLQLARDLIAEVDQAFTQPVPVILNLSTWTNKQQPLDDWLFAELNTKYRLPKKDGKRWLEERRILPLLDGLDEVKAENRAVCVEKINQLVIDYGLQGLVVCSRIKDYTDLGVRLAFYRAIYLQPLTPEQIDEYLDRADKKLASLRATLQADDALRSLARSPLILNIMTLAYQNSSAEDLSNPTLDTDEARRKHLFDAYITRMFKRRTGTRQYGDEQTKKRLSWLARNLQRHNQEVFLIESLQPSWLLKRRWQWVYFFASRFIGSLIVGFSSMAFYPRFHLPYIRWVVAWIAVSFVGGLFICLIDILRFEWVRKRKGTGISSTFWWSIINIVAVGLISGLSAGLIPWLIFGLVDAFLVGICFGLCSGLIFGSRGSRQSPENDIQTVEAVRWSWRKALKNGLVVGLSVGLVGGLISGVLVGLQWNNGLKGGLLVGSILGLLYGLMSGLLSAFFSGLSREIIESKSIANQGVWLSIRNAIFSGLLFGLLVGVFIGLLVVLNWQLTIVTEPDGQLVGRLDDGLRLGLFSIPIGALWYGGLDVIQHYTLRLILLIQSYAPVNYAHFLDYTVDRIFLQKVGGGYRFIHRLLLEHFTDLSETKSV